MMNTTRHFALALSGLALALMSISVSAQDIVIDSGSDETVISRLPSAPAQEEPVCSDTADGTLGTCSSIGASLEFYTTEQFNANIPMGETGANIMVSCDPGDVMIGPSDFQLVNLNALNWELSEWGIQRLDSETLNFVIRLFSACQESIGCNVAFNIGGLCLDATQ